MRSSIWYTLVLLTRFTVDHYYEPKRMEKEIPGYSNEDQLDELL